MPDSEISSDSKRPYRSLLREQQAAQTRRVIVEAARTKFREQGWNATSVRSIAELAGVSEAMVYAAYKSKGGLALALIDVASFDAGIPEMVSGLEANVGNPVAQLRELVGFDRRLFERGGDVLSIIMEGKKFNPELEAAYQAGRGQGERVRREIFGSWPSSVWRKGVDLEHALDMTAILCSIEVFQIARNERGWSPERIDDWWFETLRDTLFA